jgi:hypothetical protein
LDFLIPIHEKHLRRVLQEWRPSSLQPRSRCSGPLSRHSGAPKLRSFDSAWPSSNEQRRSGWVASRIPAGRDSGITTRRETVEY